MILTMSYNRAKHILRFLHFTILSVLLLFFLLTPFITKAQTTNQRQSTIGTPYITNFDLTEMAGFASVWGITQDHRGVMYFATDAGVFEFDGSEWNLIEIPNAGVSRSLAFDQKDNQIYVGSVGEIGYLEADSIGQIKYVSLKQYIPEKYKKFSDVWNTYVTKHGVIYTTDSYLFIWTGVEIKVIVAEVAFHMGFYLNDTYYIRQWEKGLQILEGDSLKRVPEGEMFAEGRIYVMLPYDEKRMLIGTRTRGLYLFDGQNFTRFKTEADDFLIENNLYLPGTKLADGRFVLATLNAGLVVLNKDGEQIFLINKANGLADEQVIYTYQDKEGGLWAGCYTGVVSRIEINSPLTVLDDKSGLKFPISDVVRFENTLYVATNSGYYRLNPSGRFEEISGTPDQNWDLLIWDNSLLIGDINGLYEIRDGVNRLIRPGINYDFRVFGLHRWQQDPRYLILTLENGLAVMKNENNRWIEVCLIKKTFLPWAMVEVENGVLWIQETAEGCYRVTFPYDEVSGTYQFEKAKFEHFSTDFGLSEGAFVPHKVADNIYFVSKKGLVFQFNESDNCFYRNDTFNKVGVGRNVEDPILQENTQGNVWANFGGGVAFGKAMPDGSYQFSAGPFNRFSNSVVNTIYEDEDGTVWFGGTKELIHYDPSVEKNYDQDYPVLVRKVIVGEDSVIFGGNVIKKDRITELDYSSQEIRFKFAAPTYDKPGETQYQSMLEGFDRQFSSWSKENFRIYTGLPTGEYKFRVRAKNIYDFISQEAVFEFKVLPPWYQTWWAYSLYVLIGVAFLLAVVLIQRHRLTKKHQEEMRITRLEEENKRKTEELERARQVQLSMLPKQMPDLEDYDIAAYMKTATEVGGDYYDFTVTNEGALIAIVGDATGHGIRAGMVVTTMKSLFYFANMAETEIIPFFDHSNSTIKKIYSGSLFMGFQLLKILGRKLVLATAGMPPAYLFRQQSGQVEEILLKAMPLGAFPGFPYQQKELSLDQWDTLLMASDGLAELFNAEKEMFGYDEVKDLFGQIAHQSSQEIINGLIKAGDDWRKDVPNNDDITFVVVKVK